MEPTRRRILLQTGRQTPPDPLLWDLALIDGITTDTRRLGLSFRGGGVASFISIDTDDTKASPLASAICKHLQRLKRRGEDDVVVLLGGTITSDEQEVSFRDVKCHKQVALKGKSEEEVMEVIEAALAEGT